MRIRLTRHHLFEGSRIPDLVWFTKFFEDLKLNNDEDATIGRYNVSSSAT